MSYKFIRTRLTDLNGYEIRILDHQDLFLSNADLVSLLKLNREFRILYNSAINSTNFDAFYWEHPVIGLETINHSYRCAIIESSSLSKVKANFTPFSDKFDSNSIVVSFSNLKNDAILLVPNPHVVDDFSLSSIAEVVRSNNESLIDELWRRVGESVEKTYSFRDVYLSTAGNGVYWCHIRLDSRPKYYKNSHYR